MYTIRTLMQEDREMVACVSCDGRKAGAVSQSVPCAMASRCVAAVADVCAEAVRFFAYCFFYYFYFYFYFYGSAQGSPQSMQKMA